MNQKASRWITGWILLATIILILIPLIFHIDLGYLGIMAIAFIFWTAMMIDCLQRTDDGFPLDGQYEKIIWSVVLVFLNIIGALLYFGLVFLNTPQREQI